MAALQERTVTLISFLGCEEPYWRVEDDTFEMIESQKFLQLPAGKHFGFSRLVMTNCPTALDRDTCLSSSIGYKSLLESRNKAFQDLLIEQKLQSTPSMFRQGVEQKLRRAAEEKGWTLTKKERQALLDKPASLTLQLPPFGDFSDGGTVVVKQPLFAQDNLVVKYDLAQLHMLIMYLQHEGFSTPDKNLPTGIREYQAAGGKVKYQYSWKDPTTRKWRKFMVNTIAEAKEGLKGGPPDAMVRTGRRKKTPAAAAGRDASVDEVVSKDAPASSLTSAVGVSTEASALSPQTVDVDACTWGASSPSDLNELDDRFVKFTERIKRRRLSFREGAEQPSEEPAPAEFAEQSSEEPASGGRGAAVGRASA